MVDSTTAIKSTILTPQEILSIGSELCITELAFLRLANAKLETDPDNPKTLWAQKQHTDALNKSLTFMSKATGLEKEATVNILNVNSKVQITSAEKVAQFEQFIREKDPDAL